MKNLILAFALLIGLNLSASHVMGGMITVAQTSQDSTTVGVWLVTDGQSPVPMPSTIYVERWEMNSVGWYVQNGTVALTAGTPSISVQGQLLTNYASEYLDLDSNKYRFIYKNCCWPSLMNSSNATSSDFIISADYWHIPYNSTPFASSPFIINQQVSARNTMKPLWNWNAFLTNPDGWSDVVEISQSDLYSGYANGTFVPQVHTYISAHVDNDSISWVPPSIGNYGTGFEIKDYRNGQLIGTQRIQWTFRVLNSTVGIEELEIDEKFEVYDWYGRYIGDSLEGLRGFYVLRYRYNKTEKVFIQ